MHLRNLSISFCLIALCGFTATAEELQVSIEATKASYFISEPIIVTLEIRNTGHEVVEINHRTYDRSGRIDDYYPVALDKIEDKVADPLTWRHSFFGGGTGTRIEILPGQSSYRNLVLNEWCLFRKPGTYRVYVKYGEAHTEPISIQLVEEPDDSRAERKRRLIEELNGRLAFLITAKQPRIHR